MKKQNQFLKNGKLLASLILLLAAASAVFGVRSLSGLKTEYSVKQFLPSNHPALRMDEAVRKMFHIEDRPTFIGILKLSKKQTGDWLEPERIDKFKALTDQLASSPHVVQVISLTNVSAAATVHDAITTGKLIEIVPPQMWRHRILHDKLIMPNLISKNGRTVAVYIQLESANVLQMVQAKARFKKMLATAFPGTITNVGGVPAVQTDLGLLLNKELVHFLLLTILACALTLILIFRTRSTIFVPLILVLYCNLMVLTFIVYTGITFTILSSTIPILVFIDVMTISCHILLRFHEESRHAPGETRWSLITRTIRKIWLPNALGSLTTCVGFLTLLLSDVPLIRTYGYAVGISILLSSFLTTLGIVPLLLVFPEPKPREWVHRPARWALWVMRNKRAVVGLTLVACGLFGVIGWNLDWTGRLFDDLPKGQEARQTTEQVDRSMGGVIPLDVVIEAPKGQDWVDPVRMAKLDHLSKDLRRLHGVGTVRGLPEFLRVSGLHGGHLPETRKAIAELYFLYGLSDSNPLPHYLTDDNRSTHLEMRVHDLPSDQVNALLAQVRVQVHVEFPHSRIEMGGMGAVVHMINDEISHDLIFGFWQALILIVGMLALVFRSFRWALVAAVPNLMPPIVLRGYLALTHTPIKPGVAIIFSIALGLAFTNTVYALNRLRELRTRKRPLPLKKTFYLESNPCLVSTLVVMMGFSVFLFSYFQLNRTFGACMLVSIVAGIVGDLMFLPAMLKWAPDLLGGELPKLRHLELVPPLAEPALPSTPTRDDEEPRIAA